MGVCGRAIAARRFARSGDRRLAPRAEWRAPRGIHVERGTELGAFAAEERNVACTLRDRDGRSEQVSVRYLAGCDGARSSVRRLAGIPLEGGS